MPTPADDKRPLEEIALTGYKSFQDLPRFKLNAGVNILIGANGSGKSNFVRFFELLGHMFDPTNRGLQNYVSGRGRADAFLYRGMKTTAEFSAHLWFGLNEYLFSLRAGEDRSLFFAREAAPFAGPKFGPITNDQGSGHTESAVARMVERGGGTKSVRWVFETVRDWRVYHFHDTSASAPMMGQCNVVDHVRLHSNAANLAAFLLQLREKHRASYDSIVESVRLIAPFFGDFDLRDLGSGQTQLLWRQRYSDLVLYPTQLSDGTIRFICLATLLLQPDPPSTIVIDEPELGLHPYAIKLLASLLKQAAERAQVLASTQSAFLVDEFVPSDVTVVDLVEGESRLRRFSEAELGDWLNDYTLGQLWEKNLLGGRP